ncbi:LTXXQ motif family [Synechococcus sp. PCC 7335]|uniref:Spy/CpxP family protein refolding chaperone n=1 Tax=Synechococcus sp. (strain ATCC 29403 / PCC 7335) TaxID=91464 RepID=UPI00017EB46B|nr:hypothetical protein [Synechococcus sp. PCC 7335]EDX86456.1 LTXXQ motif family [Synechococcus sp. PCC 7335]
MKFNLKTFSLGSLAAIALLSAPLVFISSAQAGGAHRIGHHLEQLNLSDDQSSQIQAILTDTRSQVQAVLTEEQRAILESTEGRRAWKELDLTDSQRDQIRSISEASREEVRALLTEEQRDQLQSMRQARRDRRGGIRR